MMRIPQAGVCRAGPLKKRAGHRREIYLASEGLVTELRACHCPLTTSTSRTFEAKNDMTSLNLRRDGVCSACSHDDQAHSHSLADDRDGHSRTATSRPAAPRRHPQASVRRGLLCVRARYLVLPALCSKLAAPFRIIACAVQHAHCTNSYH